jgi:hypothetical protein
MRVQFEESKEKARLANDVAEKLQVGWHGLYSVLKYYW